MRHLIVESLHIVLLHTSIVFILKAGVTAHAGIDLEIVYRHDFHMMLL